MSYQWTTWSTGDIFVIKDMHSCYISAKLKKDQTTESVILAHKSCFCSYGFCHQVRSDEGGKFISTFTEELDKLGIEHMLTSSCNSQSKSLVRSSTRGGEEDRPDGACWDSNSHIQSASTSSAHKRFLKRSPKTLLPSTMDAAKYHGCCQVPWWMQ